MKNQALSLQLLKQKRSSAVIDARKIEAQLFRLSNSTATAGMRSNLLSIRSMFRDYIATLDVDIRVSVARLRDFPILPNRPS
jgi:hypothetical protein